MVHNYLKSSHNPHTKLWNQNSATNFLQIFLFSSPFEEIFFLHLGIFCLLRWKHEFNIKRTTYTLYPYKEFSSSVLKFQYWNVVFPFSERATLHQNWKISSVYTTNTYAFWVRAGFLSFSFCLQIVLLFAGFPYESACVRTATCSSLSLSLSLHIVCSLLLCPGSCQNIDVSSRPNDRMVGMPYCQLCHILTDAVFEKNLCLNVFQRHIQAFHKHVVSIFTRCVHVLNNIDIVWRVFVHFK